MSRKGVARTVEPLTIRIRPACSTTNRRPLPSRALAMPTGADRPVETRLSDRVTLDGLKAATDAGAAEATVSVAASASPKAEAVTATVCIRPGRPDR